MIKHKEQDERSCCGHDARVSRALWPVNAQRALATDWMAQRRRQLKLLIQGWKSFSSLAGKSRLPETPVPDPLVRVLETVDLSKIDEEHFVDAQEERNMEGLPLNRTEEQAKAHSQVLR